MTCDLITAGECLREEGRDMELFSSHLKTLMAAGAVEEMLEDIGMDSNFYLGFGEYSGGRIKQYNYPEGA